VLPSFNLPVFPPMPPAGIPGLAALSDTSSYQVLLLMSPAGEDTLVVVQPLVAPQVAVVAAAVSSTLT
jgi:hypothetical protein